jgi:transglutaminase-like putative cysteine protease
MTMLKFAAVTLLALAAPASAQTPVITADGDPSVDPDTIYSLVVDPADHPEEQIALLLDDGVVRLERDGTGSRTYRYVAQILTQEAVSNWAEHTFSYDPERERFRLNWARVVRPDGTVISDTPLHVQETEVPAPEGAPIFTSRKRVRVSLSGVAPGTIVDYSYTTETVDPILAGDFFGSWSINPGATIRRSRLLLDLPDDLAVKLKPVDVSFEPRVTRANGRIVRDWSARDLPWQEAEPFMPDSNGISQYILYTGALEWRDIGRWYGGLAADRYTLTPELEAHLSKLVAGATTLMDSLRAVHRWVAQDVRYVSLSLGMGGYIPRMPADVLSSLSGDCKDKATIFVAFARHMGLRAWPVLVSTGTVDPALPSLRQFDHAIAVLEMAGGPLYTDLTAELVPFGSLPGMLHGNHGLIVYDDDARMVEFADPPAEDSRNVLRVAGTLSEDGEFRGTYEETGTGLSQYGLRNLFADAMPQTQRKQIAQAIATGLFTGAQGDSLQGFDGRDLQATPRVAVHVHVPRATARMPNGDHILTLPLEPVGNEDLLRYFETLDERRAPFHIGAVSGDNAIGHEIDVHLPAGWTADLPDPVQATSRFGTMTSSYSIDGNVLRVRRDYVGGRGIAPKETLPELIEWLRGMTSDDVKYIVLRPGA